MQFTMQVDRNIFKADNCKIRSIISIIISISSSLLVLSLFSLLLSLIFIFEIYDFGDFWIVSFLAYSNLFGIKDFVVIVVFKKLGHTVIIYTWLLLIVMSECLPIITIHYSIHQKILLRFASCTYHIRWMFMVANMYIVIKPSLEYVIRKSAPMMYKSLVRA
jgi:hypothetical protein